MAGFYGDCAEYRKQPFFLEPPIPVRMTNFSGDIPDQAPVRGMHMGSLAS